MQPLYKYYPPSTAITHVLKEGTIKWSTPFEFNDPFDNQFKLQMEPINEELITQLIIEFDKPAIRQQFQVVAENGLIVSGEELYRLSRGLQSQEEKRLNVIDCIEHFNKSFPSFCDAFESMMSATVIFCLTESHDNMKMWSHYAQNHTGIVIKFLPADPDSPLPLAKRVKYVSQKPILRYKNFSSGELDVNEKVKNLIDLYTLTKTDDWSEEREWRIVTVSRNFQKGSMILKFEPKEIQAIYLGCNISPEDKTEIVEIVKRKYPWAELYQASKSLTSFLIDFEKI